MKGIPVLMYHALEDEQHPAGAKDEGERLYIVSVKDFTDQMQFLHDNNFRTYLFKEFVPLNDWPSKGVVITFDDGHESNYTLGLPILQRYGFKAEFFITTDWIGSKHFLKRSQIVELHRAGMVIGSHSMSHPYFNDLSDEEIKRELSESKKALQDILGIHITSFSAPGGRLNNFSMVNIAKSLGYMLVCTSTPGNFKKEHSLLEIPRFVIKNSTSKKEFVNIITASFLTMLKINFKYIFLFYTKKILGNKNYEFIHQRFILANKRTGRNR